MQPHRHSLPLIVVLCLCLNNTSASSKDSNGNALFGWKKGHNMGNSNRTALYEGIIQQKMRLLEILNQTLLNLNFTLSLPRRRRSIELSPLGAYIHGKSHHGNIRLNPKLTRSKSRLIYLLIDHWAHKMQIIINLKHNTITSKMPDSSSSLNTNPTTNDSPSTSVGTWASTEVHSDPTSEMTTYKSTPHTTDSMAVTTTERAIEQTSSRMFTTSRSALSTENLITRQTTSDTLTTKSTTDTDDTPDLD